ncbi:MAG: OmpA family protein [Candidatus Eiseniibacteriota bacterium]
MTSVVRVLALSLAASLGAVGLAASGAQAASSVHVDSSVLDDLGPSRGGTPIVLTPPTGARAVEAKKPTSTEAKSEPTSGSDVLTPAPVAHSAAPVGAAARAEPPAEIAPAAGAAHRIIFAKGSAELPRAADHVLAPLVRTLAADPRAELAVNAYADGGEKGKESARRLALSRGLAVRRYLESHGIEGARALINARGATEGGPADRVDLAIAKN